MRFSREFLAVGMLTAGEPSLQAKYKCGPVSPECPPGRQPTTYCCEPVTSLPSHASPMVGKKNLQRFYWMPGEWTSMTRRLQKYQNCRSFSIRDGVMENIREISM
ncbi:hypothetical protein AVEN_221622-1 [Araneus ventricosus]|uniref:Uncharacterized protein n=1 Tax=Araneus ventricosus TaxID=182803 RepID=A0A4Y2VLH8_ARAVE|nr:hypothetical protein AVEN_221622-1 [Araneus ventricosus]